MHPYSMIRKFSYVLLTLLISSCAVITAPTGGPRDEVKPKVMSEDPPNNSTHFTSKTIEIEFDEFIQVQNAQHVVISPATDPQPEITAKKKVLTIKFKKPLEPNTTYSIFFGNNVGDINENNILENYSYVFSTGDYLDSLRVSGRVKSADGTIPDNAYLLLYKGDDDSAFVQKRPFYLAKIEKDGSIQLEHVKAGRYQVYALADKNLNYYYDLATESIGFIDSALNITGNLDSLELPLFLPEDAKLRITEYDKAIRGGMMLFSLNKEISFTKDEITIRVSEDSTFQTSAFQEADNKHIKVYFTNLPKDSGNYTLLIRDNNQLIDSVRVRVESRRFSKTAIYFTDTTTLKNLTVLETQPLKLQSVYYALSAIDTTKIELADSSKNRIPVSITRDADLKTYLIGADWKDKMRYQLTIRDSAFSDLAGNYNQQQIIFVTGISRKKAGTLILNIELPDSTHNSIIQLKDNTGKVLHTQIARDSHVVRINYGLKPAGSYTLEVIDDINNNGIWNSGNFSTKTLPEKIFKSPVPILIKENWDAEETIKVDYTLKRNPLPDISSGPKEKQTEPQNSGKIKTPIKPMKEE